MVGGMLVVNRDDLAERHRLSSQKRSRARVPGPFELLASRSGAPRRLAPAHAGSTTPTAARIARVAHPNTPRSSGFYYPGAAVPTRSTSWACRQMKGVSAAMISIELGSVERAQAVSPEAHPHLRASAESLGGVESLGRASRVR